MDYAEQYIPLGAWLLVEKDMLPEKIGSLYVPTRAKDTTVKHTSTGIIVQKSPFILFENTWEEYMYSALSVGDRIGFGATIPLLSPAPPTYNFEGDDTGGVRFVTLHVTDVIGVFCYTPEERSAFLERFRRSKNG